MKSPIVIQPDSRAARAVDLWIQVGKIGPKDYKCYEEHDDHVIATHLANPTPL